MSRWWALLGVASAQATVVVALLTVTSPWYALAVATVVVVAVAILRAPRLGVCMLAAGLIGQWPWNISRYFGAVVAVSALVWLVRHRRPVIRTDPVLLLVALYTALVLLSAVNPASRIRMASGVLASVSYLTLVWMFVTLVDSRRVVRTVVGLMMVSGVVTAVLGLIQAQTHFEWVASTLAWGRPLEVFRGRSALGLQGWAGLFRIDSITGTPDYLGLSMQTLTPFVFFWVVGQQRPWRRLAGVLALTLLIAANVLSFTRGTLVITIVLLVMAAWMADRRRLVAFGPGLALLGLAALLAWTPTRDRVISIFTLTTAASRGSLDPSAWRLRTLPIGVGMLLDRPILGFGIEQQQFNWPRDALEVVPVHLTGGLTPLHNSYLLAGIELGLGGLVVVTSLLVVTCRRLRWLVRRFESIGDLELASYARACLVAVLGCAMAMFLYPMLGSFRHFWLLLALAASLGGLERSLTARVAALDRRPVRAGRTHA